MITVRPLIPHSSKQSLSFGNLEALRRGYENLPTSELKERFAYLSPFSPFPATFDIQALMAMWLVEQADATESAEMLIQQGLLIRQKDHRYGITQAIKDFATSLCSD